MNYWEKRQEAAYKAEELKLNEYYRRLEKAFNQAKGSIERSVAGFYWRYAEENGLTYSAAQRKLSKTELGDLQSFIDKAMANIGKHNQEVNNLSVKARVTRYQALEVQIDAMLRELYAIDYQAEAEKTLKDVYDDTYYHTWYNIDQYHGFHAAFSQVDPRTVEKLIAYPFNGANFSTRIWKQKDHLQSQLMESLTAGLVRGDPPHKLTAEFAKKMQVKKYDAYRLLHTEASYLISEATHKGYKDDGVEQYQILATLDSKTCDICGNYDGKIYPVSKATVGVNMPPFHPFCRCTDAPYYGADDEEGEERSARDKEGKNDQVPANMSYGEWKSKYLDQETEKGGKISSRYISGARNPYGKKADEHAKRYYESVRHMKTDAAKIAKVLNRTEKEIQAVKNYIFVDRHDLGGDSFQRFDPDFMMAQSWQRLIDGRPKPHDITLINHEMMEMELVTAGMSQEEAHRKTTAVYNYAKEAAEYYDKIKKYKRD